MRELTFPELEHLYDELASAIDAAGPDQESVFLSKLVLSMAREFGQAARISELIRACLSEPGAVTASGQQLI